MTIDKRATILFDDLFVLADEIPSVRIQVIRDALHAATSELQNEILKESKRDWDIRVLKEALKLAREVDASVRTDDFLIVCVETGKIYDSITQAAIDMSLHRNTIRGVLNGKFKQTGGYTFKYLDINEDFA